MAYDAILNAEVAAGAPITTALMTKLRDNPIEVWEGNAGAPRIAFTALELSPVEFGSGSTNSGSLTFLSVTDLDPYGIMRIDAAADEFGGASSLSYVQIRMSDDNGATWSGWDNLIQISRGASGSLNGYLDLVLGNISATGFDEDGLVSIDSNVLVGGNANAVELRIFFNSSGSVTAAATLSPISGRTA